jgi:hypothetical protein
VVILRAVRVLLLLAPPVIALEASAGFAESGNFAGLVDIGSGRKMYLEMVDVDSDATIDADEFKAACGKGLVKKLSNSFRAKKTGFCHAEPSFI